MACQIKASQQILLTREEDYQLYIYTTVSGGKSNKRRMESMSCSSPAGTVSVIYPDESLAPIISKSSLINARVEVTPLVW